MSGITSAAGEQCLVTGAGGVYLESCLGVIARGDGSEVLQQGEASPIRKGRGVHILLLGVKWRMVALLTSQTALAWPLMMGIRNLLFGVSLVCASRCVCILAAPAVACSAWGLAAPLLTDGVSLP